MLKGKIIVLSGYSGTGKNTIINKIKEQIGESITYIPSYTTREIRVKDNEKQGSPYYFVSTAVFESMIAENEFIEYNTVHNNYYGTPVKEYSKELKAGNLIVKDIDVEGAVRMKQLFGEDVVLVFVEPPSIDELYNRLYLRGDTEEQITLRMQRIELENSYRNLFDRVIVNDNIEFAVSDLLDIILSFDSSLLTKRIPIKELTPTQNIIGTFNNKEHVKNIDIKVAGKPFIYSTADTNYIIDGHHRVIKALLDGRKTVDCTVVSTRTRRYPDLHLLSPQMFTRERSLLLDLVDSGLTLKDY